MPTVFIATASKSLYLYRERLPLHAVTFKQIESRETLSSRSLFRGKCRSTSSKTRHRASRINSFKERNLQSSVGASELGLQSVRDYRLRKAYDLIGRPFVRPKEVLRTAEQLQMSLPGFWARATVLKLSQDRSEICIVTPLTVTCCLPWELEPNKPVYLPVRTRVPFQLDTLRIRSHFWWSLKRKDYSPRQEVCFDPEKICKNSSQIYINMTDIANIRQLKLKAKTTDVRYT